MSRLAALRLTSAALLLAAAFVSPARVHAGGLEYTAAGATALGRGGAVTARADDPMVLSYNPAGLVELRGGQLLLDVNIALMDACVDPIGYYGWGAYGGGQASRFTDPKTGKKEIIGLGTYDMATNKVDPAVAAYYADKLDTVCMDQHVVPIPQLLFSKRISKDFGIGGGMLFPSISPTGQWGDDLGQIRGDTGGLRPAATRYMLLDSGNLGIFPTFGAAYRITDWLRVGAAVEWGIIWIDNTTMAGVGTGTSPSNDVIAHVRGRDLFIPAATVSVHLVPMDNLDVVAAFRWQDNINAKGFLDTTTGAFSASNRPHLTHGLIVESISQKMPWKLRGGVRYADRLVARPTGDGSKEGGRPDATVHDPFQDERWDAELDIEYQMNARNDEQVLKYKAGQLVEFETLDGQVTTATFPDPSIPDTHIEKHWKDQISIRAGGSYNILPGVFGVMGGVHYETRGVDPNYMQVDFWPVSRLGLHAGVTFRLLGTTDIVFSYAHIFQEDIVVAAPDNLDGDSGYTEYTTTRHVTHIDKRTGFQISRADPLPPVLEETNKPKNPDGVARLMQVSQKTQASQPPWIVNSGTYRSSMNVLAIGVHSHF